MKRFFTPKPRKDRAWIELNPEHLAHNVRQLRSALPAGCQLMAVVKAEAYGHGAVPIAVRLQKLGVKAFAVATIDEGIQLRRRGIRGEILVLGYTCPDRARELQRYDLIQTLIDGDYARALGRMGRKVKVHIKIDSGMHRLGFDVRDFAGVADTFMLENLQVEGIFTHLCVSDSLAEGDDRFTREQIRAFQKLLETLSAMGFPRPKVHIQSSYGLLNYPELRCDYARVGIALYGAASSPEDRTRLELPLRPVLSIRSRVALIRTIPAGEAAGYGRAFTADRETRLAVVPIGYADGVPRSLSCGRGRVLIRGTAVPILGRVCMDQLTIDVTDLPEASVGDIVTLIGTDGAQEITAAEMAGRADTIANELLSRLGARLPRYEI